MLDKSVPYIDVLMHRKKGSPVKKIPLPPGYGISFFKAGDEKDWARIETSVLEFKNEMDALIYFQGDYLPYIRELERRCLFVEDENGMKVATAMAWWCYSGVRRDPWLHWVGVKPEFQGLGLGKALLSHTLRLMIDIEGDRDFYLHTQTWSHRAIGMYEKAGFGITDEKHLCIYANDRFEEAVAMLDELRRSRSL